MKKILKWSSLLMIVLMVGFLASCSGGTNESSGYDRSENESVITEQVITEEIIHEEVIR